MRGQKIILTEIKKRGCENTAPDLEYIDNICFFISFYIDFRSAISAILAAFKRVSPWTRLYER